MRKKILAVVFTAALLVAMAVPLFGSGGSVYAGHDRGKGKSQDSNVAVCHKGRTIHIDAVDVPDHLAHGDSAGACL